jgi:predicted nucleic acid-binding protein
MASDRLNPLPSVVLDANPLYPFHLRNLLVQLGVDLVIAPRWTPRIHEEWIGNLVAAGRAPRERLLLTLELMNGALPEANVRDWETYIEGLDLPDPDDCHVLAAALAAKAETILTMNLRDFPDSTLGPHGVIAVHPDSFLCGLYDVDPELLRASTEMAHANLSRSKPSFADYLDALERQGLPQFVKRLRGGAV